MDSIQQSNLCILASDAFEAVALRSLSDTGSVDDSALTAEEITRRDAGAVTGTDLTTGSWATAVRGAANL